MAGPFHDDIGRDAHGEGVADEGASACAGAKHGIFGFSLLDALAVLIVDLRHRALRPASSASSFRQSFIFWLLITGSTVPPVEKHCSYTSKDGFGVLIDSHSNLVMGLGHS